ncbi:MAG TPA: transglycosylase SLT domain-containing protein [Actinomycetota bacterium]|nr:transglycosylase SLT domain-containing protein [Actinomycetota bacterium]
MTPLRLLGLVLSFLLTASCSSGPATGAGAQGSPSVSPSGTPSPSPSESPSPEPEPEPEPFVPAANARLPRRAPALAQRLTDVTLALRTSVAEWVESEETTKRKPPRRVTLQALYQQRAYRLLSRRPRLAGRVIARLDPGLRREARANTTAGARLRSLVTPLKPPVRLKTGPAEAAGVLLRYYRRAERRFGVEWEVLAAVNYVETKFNRVRSSSSAGAQGPMQFLPSTWEAYGLGGDVHDPRDAILGAANYLHASGAPDDYRGALYAYNHSDAYVDAVLLYANRMKRRPLSYYGYYSWQVFVITTKGDVRLTGPGLDRG